MNEALLKQKVTGETLRAYDQIIREWVKDQIRVVEMEPSVITEAKIQAMIDNSVGAAIVDSY